MNPVRLFVSHTSQYGNLAKSLRLSLLALEVNASLEVKIHEDMPGGTDWRKWIEQSTQTADGFVLLYPHEDMDMGWPNYEVARFFGSKDERDNKVVWIRNPGIRKLPAVFEPYQAYDALPDGIFKFFKEIFVDGMFSNGAPLNREVNVFTSSYYQNARIAARELAEQFADATIRPHFHTRRIQISLAYADGRKLDPDRTMIEGNSDGMKMLGMAADAEVSWSTVRRGLGDSVTWPGELEKKIDAFAAGALPPSLPPFRVDQAIYLPVVTKSEALQSQMRRITMIFAEGDTRALRTLTDWIVPAAMPLQLATFLQLVRVLMHVRYDVLEPMCQEIRYGLPARARCIEICESVLAGYLCARDDTRKAGIVSSAAFYMLFERTLWPQLDEAGKKYVLLVKSLRRILAALRETDAEAVQEDEELIKLLDDCRTNNAHWLAAASKQFENFVGMWL